MKEYKRRTYHVSGVEPPDLPAPWLEGEKLEANTFIGQSRKLRLAWLDLYDAMVGTIPWAWLRKCLERPKEEP